MTTEERIADAFRAVAVKLESAIEDGRPTKVDVHDLLETLLAVADEIDPPLGGQSSG